MSFLFYLLAFALAMGVLVIVHEYGHYRVARWCGVKVLRFSVGFGRPIWSKRVGKDGTEWAIGLFPLGGYVKMLDEREGEVAPEDLPRSFNRQTVWRRIAIVAAGPIANLILAVFIYWGLFIYGMEEPIPLLGTPVAASAASTAGIENGDLVVDIEGEAIQTWQDMRWFLVRKAMDRQSVDFTVRTSEAETKLRRLDVSTARADGWEGDVLGKLGVTMFQPKIPAKIGAMNPGSAALAAGFQVGDEVVSIANEPISDWGALAQTVRRFPGQKLLVDYLRGGQRFSTEVTPARVEENGKLIGRIGATVMDSEELRAKLMTRVRYGVIAALGKAVDETADKSAFSFVMIGKMLVGEVSWRSISGPVTIADYAGQSAKLGITYYLKFLALISLSLAVLNLLPIPVLDGGHLLYYVLEILKRGPLSERSMEIGQRVGLALLLTLMVSAFYNDIHRLITG